MNLIIVANSLKAPKKFSLRDSRLIAAIICVMALFTGSGATIGYLWRSTNSQAIADIEHFRATVTGQQQALNETRRQSEREINALAVRVAELQATANRLNALGERLTRTGHLEEGEFNFNEPPGVGGPESPDTLPVTDDHSLMQSITALETQFASQSAQLDVLESLLLGREVDQNLMPAGHPVRTGYPSSTFGYRADPFTGKSNFHGGVDFNGPAGSDVLAVADGVVSFAGGRNGYGNVVDIDHGNGYMTRYAHNQKNLVQLGQRVRSGQVIAKMGSTGRATGSHVHFEVWENDHPVNPYTFLKSARG